MPFIAARYVEKEHSRQTKQLVKEAVGETGQVAGRLVMADD